MNDCIVIDDFLYIKPADLDKDIQEVLKKNAVIKYNKQHNVKYGIILDIISIKKLSHCVMMENGSCKIKVAIEVKRFLPKTGAVVKAPAELIFKHGVLIRMKKKHLLVPEEELKKKDYRFVGNKFVNNEQQVIEEGTELTVRITSLQFAGDHFNCVCSLV